MDVNLFIQYHKYNNLLENFYFSSEVSHPPHCMFQLLKNGSSEEHTNFSSEVQAFPKKASFLSIENKSWAATHMIFDYLKISTFKLLENGRLFRDTQ